MPRQQARHVHAGVEPDARVLMRVRDAPAKVAVSNGYVWVTVRSSTRSCSTLNSDGPPDTATCHRSDTGIIQIACTCSAVSTRRQDAADVAGPVAESVLLRAPAIRVGQRERTL